jgi:hypothetical protein
VAYCLAVRPADGDRTWTVVDASYATVGPVEEWLEAHRHLWSPNTVRGYAASLAQWWSFLEQRGEAGRRAEAGSRRWRGSCRGCASAAPSSML